MIKLTSKSGATIWFNVMNILSITGGYKCTMVRTATNECIEVREDLDTVVHAIEKQLLFLAGGSK
jgi:hypothetical protein